MQAASTLDLNARLDNTSTTTVRIGETKVWVPVYNEAPRAPFTDVALRALGPDGEALSTHVRSDPEDDETGPQLFDLQLLAPGREIELRASDLDAWDGRPVVLVNQETGQRHTLREDDPDDRKPMAWRDMDYDVEDNHPFGHDRPPDPVRFDGGLFATCRDLISLRRDHASLSRAAFGVVQADDERGILTYTRTHAADTLLVALNRSAAAHSARVPLPDSLRRPHELLRTVPEGASVRLQQDGTALLLEVPGHTGPVLRPAP